MKKAFQAVMWLVILSLFSANCYMAEDATEIPHPKPEDEITQPETNMGKINLTFEAQKSWGKMANLDIYKVECELCTINFWIQQQPLIDHEQHSYDAPAGNYKLVLYGFDMDGCRFRAFQNFSLIAGQTLDLVVKLDERTFNLQVDPESPLGVIEPGSIKELMRFDLTHDWDSAQKILDVGFEIKRSLEDSKITNCHLEAKWQESPSWVVVSYSTWSDRSACDPYYYPESEECSLHWTTGKITSAGPLPMDKIPVPAGETTKIRLVCDVEHLTANPTTLRVVLKDFHAWGENYPEPNQGAGNWGFYYYNYDLPLPTGNVLHLQ